MGTKREIKEGRQYQGADEVIAYTLTTTPWGANPAAVAVKLWDVTTDPNMDTPASWTDKSATMLAGAASVLGDVITTPSVTGLTAGQLYRCEIKFTSAGNTFECYAVIQAEA